MSDLPKGWVEPGERGDKGPAHFTTPLRHSEGERFVMDDFQDRVRKYTRLSRRRLGPGQPLGYAYPSGQDRMAAQDGNVSPNPVEPKPKELLLHGDRVFHTHAHDLHFSLLDPQAQGTTPNFDPQGGRSRFDGLYRNPHPTPDEAFAKGKKK